MTEGARPAWRAKSARLTLGSRRLAQRTWRSQQFNALRTIPRGPKIGCPRRPLTPVERGDLFPEPSAEGPHIRRVSQLLRADERVAPPRRQGQGEGHDETPFGFGWTVFQALFMRDMAGGSYSRSLKMTFAPELLSMNLLMTGMLPTMMILRRFVVSAENPMTPNFWFVMSMALLVGFVVSYPMNWWLVANHLKHGMMTVRPTRGGAGDRVAEAAMSGMSPDGSSMSEESSTSHMSMQIGSRQSPSPPVPLMALLSFLALAVGGLIAFLM
jgi:hypothetical protein